MDKNKNYQKVEAIVREFARELSRSIPVEKAILFGSWAKGTAGEDSDIDLVFISPKFKDMDGLERFAAIGKARKNYEFAMDYIGLTPEEYEKASPLTTIGEVKETGKVVYP
jgi:predicted nucleotidyltransferase